MALNRYLYPQKGTNIVQEVMLSTRVTIGGTGAVTGTVCGKGVTIARGANPGEYTVTLDNSSSVYQIVHVSADVTFGTYAQANHVRPVVTSVSQTGCTLQTVNSQNGTAGDPPSGAQLSVVIIATLSSVGA